MNPRGTAAVLAAMALAAAGAMPAFATGTAKPKAVKGSWSFTDVTPDPTPDADTGGASSHCHGKLPAAPVDVNAHPFKAAGAGTLTVISTVVGDWAMEVRDAKGNVVAGADANPPASESVALVLKKGAYSVVMCNLSGAPTASATYTFQPR